MSIFLVRHAETTLNAEGRLRGLADPALTTYGQHEALALAVELSYQRFDVVLTSPLTRALQTASAIAQAADVEVATDYHFTDRDYGQWTGHIRQQVIDRWGSIDAAPGVERARLVLERAIAGLQKVAVEHPNGVVVVTHDAVIRPLISWIDPDVDVAQLRTASWSAITYVDGRWAVGEVDQKPGAAS